MPSLIKDIFRLRGLKQLGNSHYVYPNARHSRWEHSLGVMHLAGLMMDHLMKVQRGCADETDKLCVMLAGGFIKKNEVNGYVLMYIYTYSI